MTDVLTVQDLEAAKKHDTFHSEVITGRAGGSASGAEIDTATNAVTGQVQTTLPKVLRDVGFKPASFTFVTGGTLGVTDADKCIYNPAPAGDDNWYSWGGALPHSVAPGTDPTAPGSGYVPRTDVLLRGQLSDGLDANLLGFKPDELSYEQIGTIGHELIKEARNENFKLDRFFRYCRTPSASRPIMIIGDSITEGSNAVDWKVDNYASIIRKAVQRKYGHRSFGFANFDFVVFDNSPSTTRYAHNCVRSGFLNVNPFQDGYFGGTMVESTTPGDYIDITFTGKCTRIVYVQQASTGGILNVTLDGVSVGSIDTKNDGDLDFSTINSQYGSVSVEIGAASYGTHTIRITNAGGNVKVCGAIYQEYVNDNSAPIVFNLGRSSISLCDIPDGLLEQYTKTGSAILALGVNDQLTGKDVTEYRRKLDVFLSAMSSVLGSVVLCDFMFSLQKSDPYKTAMRDKAAEYGFPYLDFGRMWLPSKDENKFLGYLDTDGVHPTSSGHEFIAAEIMRVIGLSYDKGSAIGYSPSTDNTAITLTSDFSNFGSSYSPATYSMNKDGIVHLQGLIKATSAVAGYSNMFSLPVSLRPSGKLLLLANKNHQFFEIEVGADGVVTTGAIAVSANETISLSGISFKSAQG